MNRTRTTIAAGAAVAALAVGVGTAAAHGLQIAQRDHHVAGAKTQQAHVEKRAKTRVARALRHDIGLDAAAAYLGLTTDQLKADLQAGQTLAQVANATPGKSADGLVAALTAAAQTKLDALVAAGKLTSTQETALLAKLQPAITKLVNTTPRHVRAAGGRILGGALKVASDYLGVPVATLTADLKGGQTLGQVADATPGKSSAGLVSAFVAAAKTKLDAAVTAGAISSSQESAILAALPTVVGALVNG